MKKITAVLGLHYIVNAMVILISALILKAPLAAFTSPLTLFFPLFGGFALVVVALDVFGSGLLATLLASYQLVTVLLSLVAVGGLITYKTRKWLVSSVVLSALSVLLLPVLIAGLSSI